VAQLGLLAEMKGLRLISTNHHEEIHVFADGLCMRQLLLNLIYNGIKYTEPGGSIQVALENPPRRPPRARIRGSLCEDYCL